MVRKSLCAEAAWSSNAGQDLQSIEAETSAVASDRNPWGVVLSRVSCGLEQRQGGMNDLRCRL